MEAKEANLLAACKQAGNRSSNAEAKLHVAAVAGEKVLEVSKLWPLTSDAQIVGLYGQVDREFDLEKKLAITEKIIKAMNNNKLHHEAVIERGKYALKARNEAWTELLKTGRSCIDHLAKECIAHLEGKLSLFLHDPSLAPARCAEALVLAEALERAGVRPGLLEILPRDVGQVVVAKRKSVTVAA